jgi:hypothetical protein
MMVELEEIRVLEEQQYFLQAEEVELVEQERLQHQVQEVDQEDQVQQIQFQVVL